jgi:hypothetical protein
MAGESSRRACRSAASAPSAPWQAVEIFCLQRLAAEFREQPGAAVGDVDRAAQPELGLVEQEGEGVLRHHGIRLRPAHDALAQRHRVNAELAEGGAFQFAIGRVILDPLRVAPEPVALVQDRHVAVGEPRALVEMAAGQFPQPVEIGLDMAEQRVGQMDAQQIRQNRIGAVEIHPRRIRREQSRPIRRLRHFVVFGWLVHLATLARFVGCFR